MPAALFKSAWLGLQAFVFYYPLFMACLWMMGAIQQVTTGGQHGGHIQCTSETAIG